jgi:polynucleotide 5'-kinase involved in rRNA processing
MQEVLSAIKGLYSLLEKKNDTYVVLLRECKERMEQLDLNKKDLDAREQDIVAKEIKYGIIEHAEKVRGEAIKIKNEAEMLLSMSREERKTVAEWCDAEKRKAAQAIKDMDSFIEAIKQRE